MLGLFGRSKSAEQLPHIEQPPLGVEWREAHPKGAERVRAWPAAENCEVVTKHGVLKARAGEDVIVGYGPRDVAVVRRSVFERTYENLGGGFYRKRTDLPVRYFVLDHPAIVKTLEGEQRANAGDWIVQGVDGEIWPVSAEAAKRKYQRH